jgi:hypothetical protein
LIGGIPVEKKANTSPANKAVGLGRHPPKGKETSMKTDRRVIGVIRLQAGVTKFGVSK